MKAIVFHEFGPPDVLRLEDVATPVPGPGEVLLKVHELADDGADQGEWHADLHRGDDPGGRRG